MNHVNRNFNELYTKTVIKAVQKLPLPWKPNKHGRKGHDLKEVSTGCILKVGFNQTYDGVFYIFKIICLGKINCANVYSAQKIGNLHNKPSPEFN